MKQTFCAILLMGAGLSSLPAAPPPAAVKILGLFDQLRAADTTHKPVAFSLSDSEIDEYMRYSLAVTPRPGLVSLTVKFFPKNYVSTFTVIDFDAVERWKPGTIPTLLKPVLSGRKSVWIDCRFQTANAKATFSIEKAYYQSIRLPAFFVEKLIQVVVARQPEKYDTSKPLPLPFGLHQLATAEHVVTGEK